MELPSSSLLRNKWFLCASMLFITIFGIGASTVSDYGMTWDELFRFKGGDAKLSYYQKLLSGEAASAPGDSYPGLFDLPLAWFHGQFPDLGTRSQKGHIWSLCFGLCGLLAVWRIAAKIGGERAGFWALLLLVATPRYYGHMFFNPKDIPLAGTYAFGVWALVELFCRMPRPSWRFVVAVGAAAGIAMSSRIAGFLILCYFGLFVGLFLLVTYARGSKSWKEFLFADVGFWGLRGVVSGLVALVPLFVFWPTIHVNPLARVGDSVSTVQSYGWGGSVLMDGRYWPAEELPFYYVPYWLFQTMPLTLLALLVAAVVVGGLMILKFLRQGVGPSFEAVLPVAVVGFSALFPLFYLYLKDPVLYDGMRHYLFVLPPIAALLALVFEWLLRQMKQRLGLYLQVGLALMAGLILFEMWQLHPYQYVYFNQLSGGLPAAYLRDETDYWGASHKEAAEWLNAHVEQIDPEGRQVFKVHQRYTRWMLKEHLDPARFEMWQPREQADFFVSLTRFNIHESYPEAKVIHVVERRGVPLCFVFALSEKVQGDH